MNKILLVIFICLINSFWAFSQNAIDDLKKMNQEYRNNESYSMKVSYKLFPDYFATTPMTIELGDCKKKQFIINLEVLKLYNAINIILLLIIIKNLSMFWR